MKVQIHSGSLTNEANWKKQREQRKMKQKRKTVILEKTDSYSPEEVELIRDIFDYLDTKGYEFKSSKRLFYDCDKYYVLSFEQISQIDC